MEKQSLAIKELTTYLKGHENFSNSQLKDLKEVMSTNHGQLFTNVLSLKENVGYDCEGNQTDPGGGNKKV